MPWTTIVKDELHALVDHLSDDDAAEALGYLRWLRSAADALSDEGLTQVREGEAEIARGDYVTLADLHRSLSGWATRSVSLGRPNAMSGGSVGALRGGSCAAWRR